MKTINIFFLTLGICLSVNINAQNGNGADIMKKNDEMMTTKDEQVELNMVLINKNKEERSRSVKQFTKTANNLRSALIQFLSPADIKGSGFLSIENQGRDDDQWLYLPALKSTRQISSSAETDNFMGSDFTFEDLKREKTNDFIYTIKGEQIVNGDNCYVIDAVPAGPDKLKKSGYSKREIFISKQSLLFVKGNYYNKKGEHVKVFYAENVKPIEGTSYKRSFKMTMENLKSGNKTVLLFSKYQINKGLQDDLFTKRQLAR